jgi:coenzyme F420-dependent glucose-6-phosphate dehydrogenase
MANIGYHVSHEQFSPGELLKFVIKAEEGGFNFALSSDHFAPWNSTQGNSGFAWSWLGAAMSQTSFDFGIVNCPCYRYHPAIIAQAAATLDEMFPARFWLAVGSGQALNESITGEYWPSKNERNEKLKASVEIIRSLWKGETVTKTSPVKVEGARLYSLPKTSIPITGAAISPETAKWMASWADRLITISQPEEKLKKVVAAWRENGGENKPMIIKVQLSYDKSYEKALQGAYEQWKTNIFSSDIQAELRTPDQYEQLGRHVKAGDLIEAVNISHETRQHVEWINEYIDLGFNFIVLHNVNDKQEQFIEVFSENVLANFK